MSEFPEIIPTDAICDECKKLIGMEKAACVQMMEDEDGNDVSDTAPFVWFHKRCLGNKKQ